VRKITRIAIMLLALITVSFAQDPGWPRELSRPEGKLVYYQPNIDDWINFRTLHARIAVSLTPAGGKQAVGVVYLQAKTDVDSENHTVMLSDMKFTQTRFPSLDPAAASRMDQMVRTFLPPGMTTTIALERLVASTEKAKPAPVVPVRNDPPPIFVSSKPAILLIVDGNEPVRSPIPNTKLEFVVNSNWPLFVDSGKSHYYLLTGNQWMQASNVAGPWAGTTKLPQDFSKIPSDPNWADVKKAIPPPPGASAPIPQVFYNNVPAEILIFKGQPTYAKIPGTSLAYASNTDQDVFSDSRNRQYYCLVSGRWFRAGSLQGPWTFATPDLPADFSHIPSSSPAARVLASVPGTPEAQDAVLLSQIPTTALVNPSEAAAKVKVSYYGKPDFQPVQGTNVSYATNTQEKILRVGDLYYLCFQAVWFVSKSPDGPWKTADSVPKEIYTIPPSSPVYNVTYVTQTTTPSGQVESSYTGGYMGMFVLGMAVGSTVAYGTGYYYPPYIYHGAYPYPIYHPYPATYGGAIGYNPYTGRYGAGSAAYGPYGGAGRGAAYNPSTGTYSRAATAYGPGGSRTVAQSYNPYTGVSAATRQGSSPYAQWGSSVAARGNQAVATQHVSTAAGSVGSMQTSRGGSAVAKSGAYGNAYAGKSSSGDLYAGKDGNVYQRTSTGGWNSYQNGNWNPVTPPTTTPRANTQAPAQSSAEARTNAQQNAQRPAGATGAQTATGAQARTQGSMAPAEGSRSRAQGQSGQPQGMEQEFQNRQRGATQSQRFQQSGVSRGGGGRRR
jgi:hypothetical protein